MASSVKVSSSSLPAKHSDFLDYIASKPNTNPRSLLAPYNDFEAELRSAFAQEPDHPALADPHVNLVPVFAGRQDALKVHARSPDSESQADRDTYILPLKAADRRPHGSPATVSSLEEFKTNFGIFSEASLSELDWNNVVVAGSAVTTSLLPVPHEFAQSKRTKRQYYHERIAPASDVDLFLYGLSEAEAVEKIKQIERCIRDSVLQDTTTIRTKNAITIASIYPTRHVQIVLRIYKSVSEILTGFDVDCSCAAYDGSQVYATPRALAAFMTQVNGIDLTRRSPSYESRLSKYARRGFEVHWPLLQRDRIDPTIFERSFARTQGLARLLVLEKLPEKSDRESYIEERRRERGRPHSNNYSTGRTGNLKENAVDEVADWVQDDEMSSYHTFTIPYGPKYTVKKIERLLYVKDLLLNAEWNRSEDREEILHRHPAFFGRVSDVIGDCCGHCPAPRNDEEAEVAEEEAKVFISGDMTFIKDNPGRQTIGSFNPITSDDWTEMAYTGNTARLCEAIASGDLAFVEKWCSEEGNDVNRRDFTGRTPLHLAVITSTAPVVQCLVDHGARLVARLVDGRTALHLAAQRGGPEGCAMIRTLCIQSEANEEEHEEMLRRKKRGSEPTADKDQSDDNNDENEDGEEEDLGSDDSSGAHMETATDKSFVKVGAPQAESAPRDNVVDDASQEGPDIYDVNVLSWDQAASPLHLAIAAGREDAVRELAESFGADNTLPVHPGTADVILTMVLASRLSREKAPKMLRTLLDLGSTSAQADSSQTTALHRFVAANRLELAQILLSQDKPAVFQAVKHYAISSQFWYQSTTPLITAVQKKNAQMVETLLANGAPISLSFDDFFPIYLSNNKHAANQSSSANKFTFYHSMEPPLVVAIKWENFDAIDELLKAGADVNTITHATLAHPLNENHYRGIFQGQSVLDIVRQALRHYQEYDPATDPTIGSRAFEPLPKLLPDQQYLQDFSKGSFLYWKMERDIRDAKKSRDDETKRQQGNDEIDFKAIESKGAVVRETKQKFEELEKLLVRQGAKEYYDLFPDQEKPPQETRPGPRKFLANNPHLADCTPKSEYQVSALNDLTTEGYDRLFEAAWVGDLDTIKSLCLRSWGPEGDQIPLKVSTRETKGLTPFSVALLRGHVQCASGILQICEAQYEERDEDESKKRYQIYPGKDDFDDANDDDESDEEDDGGIQVFAEVLDETYTIDILQSLSKRVKSHWKPAHLLQEKMSESTLATFPHGGIASHEAPLNDTKYEMTFHGMRKSLLEHAIEINNPALFDVLLRLEEKYRLQSDSTPDAGLDRYLLTALELGHVGLAGKLIASRGAGLPLQGLLNQSGVSVPEPEPKYYQGLSVYGKKNKKWAEEHMHGGIIYNDTASKFANDPPLVHAISASNLEATQWWWGTEPERLYNQFAAQHEDLEGVRHLSKSQIGVEGEISRWLTSKRELSFHYAAMVPLRPGALEVAEFLIKNAPELIDKKSPEGGHTALQLCFALKRFEMAKLLIEAGADQTCRDNTGSNLLHTLLNGITQNDPSLTVSGLQSFLSILDPRVLSSLFTERQSTAHDQMSMTPLASWLNSKYIFSGRAGIDPSDDSKILDVLLEKAPGNGDDLDMIDGAGDTPLHICARKRLHLFAERILEKRPDLLWRENATGRTPYEMASDIWTSEQLDTAPPAVFLGHYCAAVDQQARHFLNEDDNYEWRKAPKKTIEVFERVASAPENAGQKRRLASLFEANAVSDRLARRELERRRKKDEEARVPEDEPLDKRAMRRRRRMMYTTPAGEFGTWYGRLK